MSGGEIIVIILVILLLFGADKIPELARTFGKGMNEFKKAAEDIKREINLNVNDIKSEVVDIKDEVVNQTKEVSASMNETVKGYEPYELAQNEEEYVDGTPQVRSTKKRNSTAQKKPSTKTESESKPETDTAASDINMGMDI